MALGVLLATLLGSGAALAQPRAALLPFDADSPVTAFAAQRGGISLSQATAMALARNPGRVVRAETVHMGDRTVHEIRILGNDGRVRTVRIDAQTGSFL
ncbi:MAG TPA: PepSY domain-containing protein [Gammaproteobacteria bacterium]|nr:PepSY domain-containing protein [Gammaproteobacteria bacterium]